MFPNPSGGIPKEKLMSGVDDFCAKFDFMSYNEPFRKGALIVQNPHGVQSTDDLIVEDKLRIEREHTHKWSQLMTLYYLIIIRSLCASCRACHRIRGHFAE